MLSIRRHGLLLIGILAAMGTVFLGGTLLAGHISAQSGSTKTIYACVRDRIGVVVIRSEFEGCGTNWTPVEWNVQGNQGPTGEQGAPGSAGAIGPAGPPGAPGVAPARRAPMVLPVPLDLKAKGAWADLLEPSALREKLAILEPPGLKGKSDLKDPPVPWVRQVSRRSKWFPRSRVSIAAASLLR